MPILREGTYFLHVRPSSISKFGIFVGPVMRSHVRPSLNRLKVLWLVIGSVLVDVVDVVPRRNRTAMGEYPAQDVEVDTSSFEILPVLIAGRFWVAIESDPHPHRCFGWSVLALKHEPTIPHFNSSNRRNPLDSIKNLWPAVPMISSPFENVTR